MSVSAKTIRGPKLVALSDDEASARLHRFTVDQYHRMIDAGIFVGRPRCELIYGLILEKPLPNPPHSKVTQRLMRRFLPLFPEPDWFVGVQDTITLSASEPEPDFFVATGPDKKYAHRHPGPKDIALVVEVADTTIGFDRGAKLKLYARSKIRQYWIVSIKDQRIEVYLEPRGGKSPAYLVRKEFGPVDEIPVVVDDVLISTIRVADVLA